MNFCIKGTGSLLSGNIIQATVRKNSVDTLFSLSFGPIDDPFNIKINSINTVDVVQGDIISIMTSYTGPININNFYLTASLLFDAVE